MNCRDGNNECALHSASKLGYEPIVEVLVKNGSEIDCVDLIGQTPLLAACEYGKFKIQTKTGRKIDFPHFSNSSTDLGAPILQMAKQWSINKSNNEFEFFSLADHKEVAEFLIQNGADVNHEMNYGISALHLSAKHGNFRDFMYQRFYGFKCIQYRAIKKIKHFSSAGNLEIVELLIEKGISVNHKSSNGKSALELATQNGNVNYC